MADKREEILARLEVVLGELVDARQFFRNQVEVAESKHNRIVLLDGDEEADPDTLRPKSAVRGSVMVARPEIFLVLGDPKTPGTKLNEASAQLIKAVSEDATLTALCHDGDIRYLGRFTGFAAGRSVQAEAKFEFEFRYFMRSGDL